MAHSQGVRGASRPLWILSSAALLVLAQEGASRGADVPQAASLERVQDSLPPPMIREQSNIAAEPPRRVSLTVPREPDPVGEAPVVDRPEAGGPAGPPSTLDQLIERAVLMDPDMEVARRRRSLAYRRGIRALRELFPQAKVELDWSEGSITGGHFGGKRQTAAFRQPLFHGGALWNALKRYRAEYESADQEVEAKLQEASYDITEAYLELARAQLLMARRAVLLAGVRPLYTLNDRKWSEKLIAEVEYLHADALYHQVLASYETAVQQELLARAELAKLVDVAPETLTAVPPLYDAERIEDLTLLKEASLLPNVGDPKFRSELNAYVEMAYQYRPDLGVEANRVQANLFAEKVARGAFFPTVDFILEAGQQAEAFRDDDKSPPLLHEFRFGFETTWNAGGNTARYVFDSDANAPSVTQFAAGGEGTATRRNTFSFALLDNLEGFVATKEAAVQTAEAVAARHELEKRVVRDVHEAFFRYHRSRIDIYAFARSRLYRSKLAEVAKLRLDSNEIETSEFMQAVVDFGEEEERLHGAVAEYFTAKAALNRAVGRAVVALRD